MRPLDKSLGDPYIAGMGPQIKKRLLRTLILSLIAFGVGASMALMQLREEAGTSVNKGAKQIAMPGVKIGGDFALTDHHGDTVTQANYDGQYKLIYFGFTYCPAICPTELQKISQVIGTLDEDIAAQIKPLFITVDPERDTINVMRDYVSLFDPRLTGLTGSRAQIDPVLKSFRVFASKVPTEDGSDYTMDHSSYIYFMSPDNQLISMYRIKDDAGYMVKDIKVRLENG